MSSVVSRLLSRAAGVLATSGIILAGATVPAAATGYSSITSGSWAYVDSATPQTSFVNPQGKAPVGSLAYANGTVHTFKSYVTFDLSSLRGTRIVSASLSTSEVTVADCTAKAKSQAWLTESARKPTWAHRPAEQVRLESGEPYTCPSPLVEWGATGALQRALQEGRSSVTFELTLPEDQQSDQRFFRTYDPKTVLRVSANRAPGKPTGLAVNSKDCTQHIAIGGGQTNLLATAADPDDPWLSFEFAYWPTLHPDQRTTLGTSGSSGTRVSTSIWYQNLTDGTDYAWQVRAKDSLDAGPWSATCKFTTDFTSPDKAPTVSSTDYTAQAPPGSGGTGIPGEFTFNANGVADVVGFYYGEFDPLTFVPATHRGGSATIQYTPTRSGPLYMAVASVDAAGNRSETTRQGFWVADNSPRVSCTPDRGYVGVPRDCVFSSPTSVSGYVYSFDSNAPTEIPAGPDGTAHVTLVPTRPDLFTKVDVQAKLGNGNLTASTAHYLNVDLGEPTVERLTVAPIVGRPMQLKLTAVLPGSTTFTYTWSDNQPVTVPVGGDGTAVITITPTAPYYQELAVYSTTAEGIRSGTDDETIWVATNAPEVISSDYPENQTSGEVGKPGEFTLKAATSDTVSFTYRFNDEAPVTVPVGADGTTAISLIPTKPYTNTLWVTGTLASGAVTEQRRYSVMANPVQPHVDCTPVQPTVGQHIQCTFTPAQSNVVSYVYKWNLDPEVTVPAAADHTATVDLVVPSVNGWDVPLTVWSVNNLGYRSDSALLGILIGSASAMKAQ